MPLEPQTRVGGFFFNACDGEEPGLSSCQAELIVKYFDDFWHLNSRVRIATIDEAFLELEFVLGCLHTHTDGREPKVVA